jgi:excisionase family DNA binding protein
MKQLLTVEEASDELGGISRSKTYELIRSGDLRSVQIGRRRLIPKDAVIDFVQQLTNRGNTDAASK